jgi:hypothetical protein
MKKYLLIVALMIAVVALVGLSADVAQAGGSRKTAPTHPPVCVKVLNADFVGDYYELQCTDPGNDIATVEVKSSIKYDLTWDETFVTLRAYAPDPSLPTDSILVFWTVTDKLGSKVSGTLP